MLVPILIHLQEKARNFLRSDQTLHTAGIVCEYNPFHKGHLYQLKETKRRLGEEATVVCVMSGDFVQRGEAAIFDKFARAEAACRCGADLVVELPLPWCLSSAEGFASGAVSILAALGCDTLSFGSENADVNALSSLAAFTLDASAQDRIRTFQNADASMPFARARQLAAEEIFGEKAKMLSEPNEILAIEYLKALHKLGKEMQPLAIPRIGAGHDSAAEGEYLSGMRLREMVRKKEDPSTHIPIPAMEIFEAEIKAGRMRDEKLLETALLSRLYQLGPDNFDRLPDAGGGAGRRLYHALWESAGLEETVSRAVSKRYTASRMRRMLLCAAIGICAEDTKGTPPYIRSLAFSAKGRELLAQVRGNTDLPVINKAGEIKKLGFQAEKVFNITAHAHELYRLSCASDEKRKPGEDWRKKQAIV